MCEKAREKRERGRMRGDEEASEASELLWTAARGLLALTQLHGSLTGPKQVLVVEWSGVEWHTLHTVQWARLPSPSLPLPS